MISPWILDYANVVPGFGGFWNEVAVGATIAFLALARVAFPRNFATLSWVNAVLGAWLIAAPWVLGYNDTYDIPKAFWNDIATGAAIIILAFSSFGATRVAHLRGRQAIQGS